MRTACAQRCWAGTAACARWLRVPRLHSSNAQHRRAPYFSSPHAITPLMDVDARRQGVRCTIGEQGVCALSADCPGKAVRVPHARTDASLEVSGARSTRGVCHAPVDRPVGGTVVNAAVTVVHVDAHGVAQELRTLARRHPLQVGTARGRAHTRTWLAFCTAAWGTARSAGSVACAPMRELRRGSAVLVFGG